MKRILLLFVLSILFQHTISAQCESSRYQEKIFEDIVIYKDVQYGSNINNIGKHQDLFMDVYMPDPDLDTIALRPVILFMHGGAYVAGSKNKNTMQFMGNEFSRRGYVAIPVQYRLEKSTVDFEPILEFGNVVEWNKAIVRSIHDIKGAIRHLKYLAAEEGNPYHIDTNNITLYGSSAGAIGVMHSVYLDDEDEKKNLWNLAINELGGLEGNTSKHLQYGSTNTVRNLILDSGAFSDVNWIGDKNDVDVLSLHHDKDPTVPYGAGCYYIVACHLGKYFGSAKYVPYLEGNGTRVVAHKVSGVGHPVDDLDPQFVLEKSIDFLYDSQCKYDTTQYDIPTNIKNSTISEVKIYPNPNNGQFQIFSKDLAKDALIQIFSLSGRLVYEQKSINISQDIQLDEPNGLYFLSITDQYGAQSISKLSITR